MAGKSLARSILNEVESTASAQMSVGNDQLAADMVVAIQRCNVRFACDRCTLVNVRDVDSLEGRIGRLVGVALRLYGCHGAEAANPAATGRHHHDVRA